MNLLEIKRKIRKLDLLDFSMLEVLYIVIGIVLATYISSLRGFVDQNILVVLFIFIVIAIRPVIRMFKK